MEDYICFAKDCVVEDIGFNDLRKRGNNESYSKITYKGSPLVVQSSKILISKIKDNYIELEFHKSSGSEQFYNLLCDIEDKVFSTIMEKSDEWFRVNITESQLEEIYKHSTLPPSRAGRNPRIKFKISSDTTFFKDIDTPIKDITTIKPGNYMKVLIEIKNISFYEERASLEIILHQGKVHKKKIERTIKDQEEDDDDPPKETNDRIKLIPQNNI